MAGIIHRDGRCTCTRPQQQGGRSIPVPTMARIQRHIVKHRSAIQRLQPWKLTAIRRVASAIIPGGAAGRPAAQKVQHGVEVRLRGALLRQRPAAAVQVLLKGQRQGLRPICLRAACGTASRLSEYRSVPPRAGCHWHVVKQAADGDGWRS